jgi:YVTN family beta-propeller protein
MFRFENCINKMGITLMTALVALTLAGPVLADNDCQPPANTVIDTIKGFTGPYGLAVDSNRGVAYVSNFGGNTLSVIDEATNAVTATITVGSNPFDVQIDPFRGKVYVSNYFAKTVSVIDEATNTVTATIAMPITVQGGNVEFLAVDPVRGKVYATVESNTANYVAVIDENTDTIVKTVTLSDSPIAVGVDPIRGTIYVGMSNLGPYNVIVMDPRTYAITATIPMPSYTVYIAVDPVTGLVYASNTNYVYAEQSKGIYNVPGTVSVIDERTNEVTATIVTGPPSGSGQATTEHTAIDPINRTVYTTNASNGTLSVIDAVTNTVTDTIQLSSKCIGVGVDPARRTVYVANKNDNTVSVVSAGGPRHWRDPFGDFLGDHSKR